MYSNTIYKPNANPMYWTSVNMLLLKQKVLILYDVKLKKHIQLKY